MVRHCSKAKVIAFIPSDACIKYTHAYCSALFRASVLRLCCYSHIRAQLQTIYNVRPQHTPMRVHRTVTDGSETLPSIITGITKQFKMYPFICCKAHSKKCVCHIAFAIFNRLGSFLLWASVRYRGVVLPDTQLKVNQKASCISGSVNVNVLKYKTGLINDP